MTRLNYNTGKYCCCGSCMDAVEVGHASPSRMVSVMLADATFRFTCLDGRAEEIAGKAGQVPKFRRSSICRRTSASKHSEQSLWN